MIKYIAIKIFLIIYKMWILGIIYTLLVLVVVGITGLNENAMILLAFCAICIWISYDYMQYLRAEDCVMPWKTIHVVASIDLPDDPLSSNASSTHIATAPIATFAPSMQAALGDYPISSAPANNNFDTNIASCEPNPPPPSIEELSIVSEYNPKHHEHFAGTGDNLLFNRMKYTGTQERRAVEARSALTKFQYAPFLEEELAAEEKSVWWEVDQLEK